MKHTSRAFTLVELSIVLVIIGLLAGGLVVGTSLVRNAELQSISKDFGLYEGAVMQFQEQYDGFPGDITNATDYWGTDGSGCPTNSNMLPRKETCDGDGSGLWANAETFRAWQQLGNSGLVDGLFAGVAGSGGTMHNIPGVNAPEGRITNSVFALQGMGSIDSSHTDYFAGDWGNIVRVGVRTSNDVPWGSLLKGKEAYAIDLKMDDGRPGTGRMASLKHTSCPSTTSPSTAEYQLTSNSLTCILLYSLSGGSL